MSLFAAFSISGYCAWLFVSYKRSISSDVGRSADIDSQTDVSSRFDDLAKDYDYEVGTSEWMMGMKSMRKRLIQQARGDVLEVSVGTGRNTPFYAEELDRQRRERQKKSKGSSGVWDTAKGIVGVGGQPDSDFGKEPEGITSLTFVDKSAQMIDVARRKWDEEMKYREDVAKRRGMWSAIPGKPGRYHDTDGLNLRWIVGDAENINDIPAPSASTGGAEAASKQLTPTNADDESSHNLQSSNSLTRKLKSFVGYSSVSPNPQTTTFTGMSEAPTGSYDTIIQTMGLCSTPDPVRLLKNLGQLCKQPSSANPQGGQILLLEHGRSRYKWLDNILDNTAPGRAERYGCWYNRDIGKIVEDSGLEVVNVRRYHMGTTWEYTLRPKK